MVWRERAEVKGVGERVVSGVGERGEEKRWEVAGREGVVGEPGAWSCSFVAASMFAVEGRDFLR
jgi:hypothetical protein